MARRLPFIFMRGGTSRGGYFLKQHLPADDENISKVLLTLYGTIQPPPPPPPQDGAQSDTRIPSSFFKLEDLPKDPRQVSGLGGASSVTSEAAIISRSKEPGVDIDYRFAQVSTTHGKVDFEPSSGNIISGVGPAAIEMGLVDTHKNLNETMVRIRSINNNSLVEAVVQTPGGVVTYEGTTTIDGVGGYAAPVTLNFRNVVGSKTKGKLLPTGNVRDVFEGVEVTCIDVAMPMVIAKATSFGKSGYEGKDELDKDGAFFEKLEAVRKAAGWAMGLGDVTGRVIPKFAIVAEPREDPKLPVDANITARYFVPDNTHYSMAVTGAICLGSCSILEGSVAYDVSKQTSKGDKHKVVIAHPSGSIQIIIESEQTEAGLQVKSADVLRTARLITVGLARLPPYLWEHDANWKRALDDPCTDLYFEFRDLFRTSSGLRPEPRDSTLPVHLSIPGLAS